MGRIKVVGLCLVTMLALGALGASAAQAGEVGICGKAAKAGKLYTGKYLDKNCTEEASEAQQKEGKKNKYEFEPGTTGNHGLPIPYTGKGKTKRLYGEAGSIVCPKTTLVGEFTGPKAGADAVTVTGCTLSVTNGACTTEGEAPGTIEIDQETQLIDHGEKGPSGLEPKAGEVWDAFAPRVGSPFYPNQTEFSCSGIPFSVNGTFSGVLTPVNTATTKLKATIGSGIGEQDLSVTFFNPLTSKVETGPGILENVVEAKVSEKIVIHT